MRGRLHRPGSHPGCRQHRVASRSPSSLHSPILKEDKGAPIDSLLPLPRRRLRALQGGGARLTSARTSYVGGGELGRQCAGGAYDDLAPSSSSQPQQSGHPEDQSGTSRGHWSEKDEFSSYGNTATDTITLPKRAFDAACQEIGLAEKIASKLWLRLHEQCFLAGGEHITLGVSPPREDARNVNAWHWDNANLMPWAQDRLRTLMVGLEVPDLPDRGSIKVTGLDKCEGDCETNTRKGKVMVCFDMKVVVAWEAHVNYEEARGTISMPYIDNVETEDGDIRTEVNFKKEKDGPSCPEPVKHVVRSKLVPIVQAQMRQFLKELHLKGTKPAARRQADILEGKLIPDLSSHGSKHNADRLNID
mmetsp:Transcript_13500/g.33098  ORF Transcript_13500/g.33098 Transcript_13500/m.33098 type:complete len:361 (+) Transcript_13500:138-1220(+)